MTFPTIHSIDVTLAVHHLQQADPKLAEVIHEVGTLDLSRRLELSTVDHFGTLVYGIIGQRNAERVTINILAQIQERYGKPAPAPQEILDTPEDELAHLVNSYKKRDYLRSLAEHVVSGQLQLDHIADLSDEEIIGQLTAVKGVGPWTAEQFLFWHLERADVLAVGDPAIQKAVMCLYHLKATPDADKLTKIAAPWRPYRTLACHYLLRSKFGPGVSPGWPSSMPRPLQY